MISSTVRFFGSDRGWTRHVPVLLILALALTGCFGSGSGGGWPGSSAATFDLQGTVVGESPEGAPIAGATVRVAQREALTGPDGTFAFRDLPVGTGDLELTAGAPGYLSRSVGIAAEPGQLATVIVVLTRAEPSPGEPGGGNGNGDENNGENGGSGDGSGNGGGDPSPELPDGDAVVEVEIRLVNTPAAQAPVLKPASAPSDRVSPVATRRSSPAGLSPEPIPGQWIVQLTDEYPVQTINDMWSGAGVQVVRRLADNFYLVESRAQDPSPSVEARLAALPGVVAVEPNQRVYPVALTYDPGDPYYARQWSLPLISVPDAWRVTTGSREVVVAVLDTGIRPDHPDLDSTAIVSGRNFADDKPATDYTDDARDMSHGTMVAGIIGAMTGNGRGVAGINWSVSIMPVRVLSSLSGGTVAAVGEGIRWAVDNGAHVINMSLAWDASYNDNFVNQQIEYAASRGVIMVAGVGNDRSRVTMPASHPAVIAVGAVDRYKQLAWYSNYGPELELVAPGGDTRTRSQEGVLSTDVVQGSLGYSYQQGTSFSAPHVAGVVALMYSTGITDPDRIRTLLRNTAEDLGPPGPDSQYGYGLINAYAAVTQAEPMNARVGVVSSGGQVWGPTSPQGDPLRPVARVENVAAGRQSAFAWIDATGDGLLGEGDLAAIGEVDVPENGTVSVQLSLAIWDALPVQDRELLSTATGR